MRRWFLAVSAAVMLASGTAFAADLGRGPPAAPAPPPPPVATWTGCYVGVEAGGNWGRSQHVFNDPADNPANVGLPLTSVFSLNGGLVGGTVGCNYQFGNVIVVGIENDFSWTNPTGKVFLIPPFITANTSQTRERWLDTLRARAGFAWDRWYLYGTGGAAFAGESFQVCNAAVAECGGQSKNVTGWTAGLGVEYALSSNWSVKVEYLYVDLGSTAYVRTNLPGAFIDARKITLTDNIVRAGLNYKFN